MLFWNKAKWRSEATIWSILFPLLSMVAKDDCLQHFGREGRQICYLLFDGDSQDHCHDLREGAVAAGNGQLREQLWKADIAHLHEVTDLRTAAMPRAQAR